MIVNGLIYLLLISFMYSMQAIQATNYLVACHLIGAYHVTQV